MKKLDLVEGTLALEKRRPAGAWTSPARQSSQFVGHLSGEKSRWKVVEEDTGHPSLVFMCTQRHARTSVCTQTHTPCWCLSFEKFALGIQDRGALSFLFPICQCIKFYTHAQQIIKHNSKCSLSQLFLCSKSRVTLGITSTSSVPLAILLLDSFICSC